MKTRLLLTILMSLLCATIFPQPTQSMINEAKRALGYMDKNKYAKALVLLTDVARKWDRYDEGYPKICFGAGNCAYRLEDYAKAIDWYSQARRYGKFDQNTSDDLTGYLASSFANYGDYKSAEIVFIDAIKGNFNISKILRDYISDFMAMVKDSKTKDEKTDYTICINILLELEKKTYATDQLGNIFSQLGDFYSTLGIFHEAKDNYEKAVAINPSFSPYYNLGSIYWNLGLDYYKSAMLIDTTIKDYQIKKDNFFILSDKCYSYALFYLEQAFLINPLDALIKKTLLEKYKELKESEKIAYITNNTLYAFLKSNLLFNQFNYSKRIGDQSSNLVDLFYRTKDAIVKIEVSLNDGKVSQGSGFIVTQDGICVSNYHVFVGSSFNNATIFIGNKQYKLEKVIESNNNQDYVIFKIANIYTHSITKISPTIPMIGEEVYAIGNPFGFENTLSKGIISGYRQNNTLLQTTADITFGSSGGALFNLKGEVIGITSSGIGEGNLNFAINIQGLNLKRFINQ